jgi:hypothetical protein
MKEAVLSDLIISLVLLITHSQSFTMKLKN